MDRHSATGREEGAYDAEYWAHFLDDLAEASEGDSAGGHLITVDELRAAGALEVPPEWRKSLGGDRSAKRGLFADESLWEKEEEGAEG